MLGFTNVSPTASNLAYPPPFMSSQNVITDSAASSRVSDKRQLLSISLARAGPERSVAVKQVDFDPRPSPSTYCIYPRGDCSFPYRSRSDSSNCRFKDCSPSTGSSATFSLSDPDTLRCSIGSASELRESRKRHFGSLVYHWSDHRGVMSPHDQETFDDRRYADDTLWGDTNSQSNQEIRYALVEAFKELQAIKDECHEDCFETQRQW